MAGHGLGTPAYCAAALALAATAMTPAPAQAQAQPRPSATLEEVTVTARKREESLQDVPLSVQAVSGDTLDQLGVHDLASLQSLTPGLTLFQNTDRSYGQVFLRGMSNVVPVGDTTRELASVFIDGVYYVGAIPVLALDTVERVEVVKGPQSALYGRSTFSGAINLVTRVPQDELAGSVGIRLAQDNEVEWTGSVEGSLLPGMLTGRVYGRLRGYDGQYTNSIGGGRVGAEDDEAWGIQLHFTPADWVDAKLNYMHQRQSDGAAASQLIGRQPTHNCGPFPPATRTMVCGEVEYTGGKDGVALNLAPPEVAWPNLPRTDPGLDRNFSFISANVAFNLPAGMTLTYLGGYSEEDFTNLYDFDRTGTDAYWSLALRKQH